MREDLGRVPPLIAQATEALAAPYFLLPIADALGGAPLMAYRERVYAYELYHQLRQNWPDWPYMLSGEIDKRGHPVVRGHLLDNVKPDLLIHVPGRMDRNLVAIEIKPLRPDAYPDERHNFQQDIRKLIAFRELGYFGAIFLVFGESLDRLRTHAAELRREGIPIDEVQLFHHSRAGTAAAPVQWEVR
jgi:hypothetical protein